MENLTEKARSIITENQYLSLATCSKNDPWVAGLAYAVDKAYTFFFYSAKDSKHALHIKDNSNVAFTIFNSTLAPDAIDGLQIAGIASQVKITFLPSIIKLYYDQLFTDELIREKWKQPLAAFKDVAIKRFFQIIPTHVYKLDLSIIEVDKRVEIDLNDLRSKPAK